MAILNVLIKTTVHQINTHEAGDVLEMYRNVCDVWDVDTFWVSQMYQQYGHWLKHCQANYISMSCNITTNKHTEVLCVVARTL